MHVMIENITVPCTIYRQIYVRCQAGPEPFRRRHVRTSPPSHPVAPISQSQHWCLTNHLHLNPALLIIQLYFLSP